MHGVRHNIEQTAVIENNIRANTVVGMPLSPQHLAVKYLPTAKPAVRICATLCDTLLVLFPAAH